MTHSRWLFVILLCSLAGCNNDAARQQAQPRYDSASSVPAPEPAPVPAPASAQSAAEPAAEKTDTLRIEGDAQPVKLRLYRPQSSLPFLTYVPADMIAETRSADDGEAHYFFTNFAGKRNDNAFLLVFVLPAGATRADMTRLVTAFQQTRQQKGFVTAVEPHERGGRFYYVARHYPAEYGDGFGPRAHRILGEWQWLDATSEPRNE